MKLGENPTLSRNGKQVRLVSPVSTQTHFIIVHFSEAEKGQVDSERFTSRFT